MKILMLASYLYDDNHKEFCRNKTGYGLIIPEIAASVGAENDVFISTYLPTNGFKIEKIYGKATVINSTKKSMVFNIRFKDIVFALKTFLKPYSTFKRRIHAAYYALNTGRIVNEIKKINPDIVHIHDKSEVFISACKEVGVPFVVTLHGLNYFIEGYDEYIKNQELEFICDSLKTSLPITVISTGIKKRIEKFFLNSQKADNIFVVPNGTSLERVNSKAEKRKNIIISIGSLCGHKNQKQIIEAVSLIKDQLTDWKILFCGKDTLNGELQELSEKLGLNNIVVFKGFVKPSDIDELLSVSKLNILASKEEGFGLSLIEAATHGVPSVTFADLDAVPDVYFEEGFLLCNSRDNSDLADTILKATGINWNAETIRVKSKKFSLQNMALRYVDVYKKVLNNGK